MAGFMDIVSELGLTADDISQQGYPEPLASNSFHYAGPCNSTGCSQYTMQQLPLHPNYCSEHSSFHHPWSSVNHSFPSNYIQWFNCTQHQMHPLNISGHHSVPCDNNEKTSQCVQHMQTIANGFGDPFALPNYNGLPQFTQQQTQSTINGYLQSIEQKPKVTHMEPLQGGNQFQSIGGLKQADISTTLQRLNSEKPTMVEIMSEETKMKSSDGGKFLIPYTGGQRSCNQGVNPNLYWNLT
ncbi:uncharacterized protein LOC131034353 [Cryptomeria japonica]|uniref:uncharacterized protein LOC131034353 n=1 Tax=Cryptomeria japonica TaxID=3369 RepID=UPI0027D9E7F9|nr:uncharacterized protein LOC131034353 [Cryptomeria japonica]